MYLEIKKKNYCLDELKDNIFTEYIGNPLKDKISDDFINDVRKNYWESIRKHHDHLESFRLKNGMKRKTSTFLPPVQKNFS